MSWEWRTDSGTAKNSERHESREWEARAALRGQHEASFCATPRHGVVLAGAQSKPESSRGALSQQQGQGVQFLDSIIEGSTQ